MFVSIKALAAFPQVSGSCIRCASSRHQKRRRLQRGPQRATRMLRPVKASKESSSPVYRLNRPTLPTPEFLEGQKHLPHDWGQSPILQAAGEEGGGSLNWTWHVVLDHVRTSSTLTASRGQDLAWAAVGGVLGDRKRGMPVAGAGVSPYTLLQVVVVPHPRVGLVRREGGHKQYENIILANYSAASLVLSKILWSKKYKGSTPLKNYSFKYLQKQFMIYYIINTQYMNKFFSESTCELLFQYESTTHGHTYTFPNGPPPSCVSHYSILNGEKKHRLPIYIFLLKGS